MPDCPGPVSPKTDENLMMPANLTLNIGSVTHPALHLRTDCFPCALNTVNHTQQNFNYAWWVSGVLLSVTDRIEG